MESSYASTRKTFSFIKDHPLFNKYYDVLRYLCLTVCGFAIALIFNALKGYSFSEKTLKIAGELLVSPLSSGKNGYGILGDLISGTHTDLIFVSIIFISGLTYICDTVISCSLMARGFILGIRTGVFATGASGFFRIFCQHPAASAVIVIIFYTLTTLTLILFSSITVRGTQRFRSVPTRERTIILSKNFISVIISALICYGITVILNILQAVILKFI